MWVSKARASLADLRVRRAAALAAAVWAAAIWWVGGLPQPPVPGPPFPWRDKLAHGLAYAVLGGLVAAAAARPGRRPFLLAAAALLACAVYGVADEVHQSFTPERVAGGADVLADALGGLAGGLAVARLHAGPPIASLRKEPS